VQRRRWFIQHKGQRPCGDGAMYRLAFGKKDNCGATGTSHCFVLGTAAMACPSAGSGPTALRSPQAGGSPFLLLSSACAICNYRSRGPASARYPRGLHMQIREWRSVSASLIPTRCASTTARHQSRYALRPCAPLHDRCSGLTDLHPNIKCRVVLFESQFDI
jgi:hypothetical protein